MFALLVIGLTCLMASTVSGEADPQYLYSPYTYTYPQYHYPSVYHAYQPYYYPYTYPAVTVVGTSSNTVEDTETTKAEPAHALRRIIPLFDYRYSTQKTKKIRTKYFSSSSERVAYNS